MRHSNAYELLAQQPMSVSKLSIEQRDAIVISAFVDQHGTVHVISRYGDPVWDLWPFFEQSNIADSRKKLFWSRIPASFGDACKAVIYRYWLVGAPGKQPPRAVTLTKYIRNFSVFTGYLDSIGIKSLASVRPLHIANFVHHVKVVKEMSTGTLTHLFIAIESLHRFADQHPDGLACKPWPDSSAYEIAGRVGTTGKQSIQAGRTPLIPQDTVRLLFLYAEKVLAGADALLDECDAGSRTRYQDRDVMLIRDACFFLLGVLTGMRCEELVGIEVGAGRTEIKNGTTYHWVRSIEHKTLKGRVEYLMPAMGHEILRVLERWSAPLRRRLSDLIVNLESDIGDGFLTRQRRIVTGKADFNRLFLGIGQPGVHAVSGSAWSTIMRRFATAAGVDWRLSPHQMRRLYAWTFVRHRLGNLVFLKEQFKHSSIDMSQLYAANPYQDAAIYEEVLIELRSQKVDLIQSWLYDDQPLAGGAGKKIMAMRAHDFPDRRALIEETSDRLNIRSTGHAWCLAQDEGCGGAGLYEHARCASCSNGVIDSTFKQVWREIYRHQGELIDEVHDLGPGAAQRVYRDLEKAGAVLEDLGVDIIQGENNDGSIPG